MGENLCTSVNECKDLHLKRLKLFHSQQFDTTSTTHITQHHPLTWLPCVTSQSNWDSFQRRCAHHHDLIGQQASVSLLCKSHLLGCGDGKKWYMILGGGGNRWRWGWWEEGRWWTVIDGTDPCSWTGERRQGDRIKGGRNVEREGGALGPGLGPAVLELHLGWGRKISLRIYCWDLQTELRALGTFLLLGSIYWNIVWETQRPAGVLPAEWEKCGMRKYIFVCL